MVYIWAEGVLCKKFNVLVQYCTSRELSIEQNLFVNNLLASILQGFISEQNGHYTQFTIATVVVASNKSSINCDLEGNSCWIQCVSPILNFQGIICRELTGRVSLDQLDHLANSKVSLQRMRNNLYRVIVLFVANTIHTTAVTNNRKWLFC